MAKSSRAPSRRRVVKLLLALPFVRFLDAYLARFIGLGSDTAIAAAPLRVAKVSELTQPWSSVSFPYRLKVRSKDVYKKETVTEETIPGLVIRLPDDVAEKRGGGVKGKFYVVDLHCTHQRCVTTYLQDKNEIRAVADIDAKNPMAYCPCHRSVFDLGQGGKVVKGPAKQPLWKFEFDIKKDEIVVTGVDPKASQWDPGRPGELFGEYPVREGEPGL
ncbi:MAG: Rieske 2Fe-2S domain-containing protein [Deltaproteobacteria bacterium]|nr:Rieske 2Fe-2S domain-containing protein [Deltaproteobacteria bacterium]